MNIFRVCSIAALCGLILLLSGLVFAQSYPLTPEAQAEYDAGNVAFDQQQWEVALRHYALAHQLDQKNPRIIYNLGLSHARAGHELSAAAWLEAYLAIVPKDSKASQIHQEISRLLIAAEGKTNTLLKEANTACDELVETTQDREWKHYALQHLACAYLGEGEEAKAAVLAVKAGPSIGLPGSAEDQVWRNFTMSLMENNEGHRERTDPQRACRAASHIQDPEALPSDIFWESVCQAFQLQRRWEGIREAAAHLQNETTRATWIDIADAQTPSRMTVNARDAWIDLAEKLSTTTTLMRPEDALKNSSVVFWTWSASQPIRPEDMAWRMVNAAECWSEARATVKALQQFFGHP